MEKMTYKVRARLKEKRMRRKEGGRRGKGGRGQGEGVGATSRAVPLQKLVAVHCEEQEERRVRVETAQRGTHPWSDLGRDAVRCGRRAAVGRWGAACAVRTRPAVADALCRSRRSLNVCRWCASYILHQPSYARHIATPSYLVAIPSYSDLGYRSPIIYTASSGCM